MQYPFQEYLLLSNIVCGRSIGVSTELTSCMHFRFIDSTKRAFKYLPTLMQQFLLAIVIRLTAVYTLLTRF